jgi:S1-C subfamily serine protease
MAFGNLFVSGRVGATTATTTGALTTVATSPATAVQTTTLTTTSAGVPNIASAAATARAATVLVLNLDRTGATQGSGSGFIIDPSGIIVTNNHVVTGAQAVSVQLPDGGTTYTATVVGTDAQTDLAVLRIDAQDLPTVALGNSADLGVGDWVVAVGNALALDGGPTVTAGVVSATGRDVEQAGTAARPGQSATSAIALYDLIQTDAAINEGDSGGPLVDLTGAVVGINTLGTTDAQGIGFAIAIDEARPIIEQLLATGKVTRATLGISGQTVTAASAAGQNLDQSTGVMIAQVTSNGPAAAAGLRAGDIITQIGNTPIANQGGLQEALLTTYAPGQTVTIQIERGGTAQTVTVTLG